MLISCILLLCISNKEILSSDSLENFMIDVENASSDLSWIREFNHHDQDDSFISAKSKRNADGINNILATFNVVSFRDDGLPGIADEIESGAAWYNSFRSNECQNASCANSKLRSTKNIKKKKKKKRAKNNFKKTHKSTQSNFDPKHSENNSQLHNFVPLAFNPNISPIQSAPETLDHRSDTEYYVNLGHRKLQPNIDYHNPMVNSAIQWIDPKASYQDQSGQSAYYSLRQKFVPLTYQSNFDNQQQNANLTNNYMDIDQPQEANSSQPNNIELKDQIEQTQNDLSHEANYKLSKIEQDDMDKRANISWPLQHPEYEMSLLMQHYQQPLVQHKESRNYEKAENSIQQRSLNPINDIELNVSDQMISKEFDIPLSSDALDSRKFITIDNILQDKPINQFSMNLKNSLDWRPIGSKDFYSTGRRILQLTEDYATRESLNLKPQTQPEDFRHRFRRSILENPSSDTSIIDIHEPINEREYIKNLFPLSTNPHCTGKCINNKIYPLPPGYNINQQEQLTTPSSLLPNNGSETVKIKIGITINATVHGNCTKNLAMGLNNPKTVIVTPDKSDEEKMVEKRGIIFTHIPSRMKKRTNNNIRESLMKTNKDSPLNDLVTGKLPSQVVNAVFEFAKNSVNLRTQIWPALKNRKFTTVAELPDFSTIENENNVTHFQHSEQMLRQVMETLNAIIEQRVRSRTCILLRPNLQMFYDQIISSRAENEKTLRSDRKHKSSEHNHDANHILKRSAPSEPLIRQKKSIVKKLLNQFDYLSSEDQDKIKDIKDFLQMHSVYLNELELNERRIKRHKRDPKLDETDKNEFARDIHSTSDKFLRLLNAAEYIRKNSYHSGDTVDYDSFLDYEYF